MLMDNNLRFSSGQVVTGTADSTFTYDILKGNSVQTAGGTYAVPSNDIIGNATYFGEDLGLGRGMGEPWFVVSAGAGVPAAATSLAISVLGAPDNGGGTLAGLSFVPYVTSGVIPLASILGGTRIWAGAWPKRQAQSALPRFIKLNYAVAGANFTGLTINADVTTGPDTAVETLPKYAANF